MTTLHFARMLRSGERDWGHNYHDLRHLRFSPEVGWLPVSVEELEELTRIPMDRYRPNAPRAFEFYSLEVNDPPPVDPAKADGQFFVRMTSDPSSEFTCFPCKIAGRRFDPDGRWVWVTRADAVRLGQIPCVLKNPASPRLFEVREQGAPVQAAASPPSAPAPIPRAHDPVGPARISPASAPLALTATDAKPLEGEREPAATAELSADAERALKARLRAEILAELEAERMTAVKPVLPHEPASQAVALADSNQMLATSEDPEVDASDPEGLDTEADIELDAALNAGTIPLEDRVLASLRGGPLSTTEIARALELKGVPGGLKRTLRTLLGRATVELTIPDKPGSRFQQYRLVQGATPGTMPDAADPVAHAEVQAASAEAPLEAHQVAEEVAAAHDAPATPPHADAPTFVARVIDGRPGADTDGVGFPANRESDRRSGG